MNSITKNKEYSRDEIKDYIEKGNQFANIIDFLKEKKKNKEDYNILEYCMLRKDIDNNYCLKDFKENKTKYQKENKKELESLRMLIDVQLIDIRFYNNQEYALLYCVFYFLKRGFNCIAYDILFSYKGENYDKLINLFNTIICCELKELLSNEYRNKNKDMNIVMICEKLKLIK